MNDDILYTFCTTLEYDDYKKFLHFITFRKSIKTISSIITIAAVSTAMISFLLRQSTISAIVVIFLVMLLISFSCLMIKLDKQVKKLFSTSPDNTFKKQQTITLYPDHITASNRMDDGETSIFYQDLHEFYEIADILICYFTKELATPIRKKDIPQEQYAQIIDLLKVKLGKRYIEG